MVRRRIANPASSQVALRRLGKPVPLPFFGRESDLDRLSSTLAGAPVVVLVGAIGAGKTRLVGELATRAEALDARRAVRVSCAAGDGVRSIAARAERGLDLLPGGLRTALADQAVLVIIDDAHHLGEAGVRALVESCSSSGAGRLLLVSREVLPLPRRIGRAEIALEGLEEPAARALWGHLEESHGPTPASACDAAIGRTRGMPLALRREYSRAAFGPRAWEPAALAAPARRVLEAMAVLEIPAAAAAVADVAGVGPESALAELIARQLVDTLPDGRFCVHEVVREAALAALTGEERAALAARAADRVSPLVGVPDGPPAWRVGDDGALGLSDPIERLRWSVQYLLAAGDVAAAARHVRAGADRISDRGAVGDLLGMVAAVETRVRSPQVAAVRAEMAARQGRVAEALEAIAAGAAVDPVFAARLAFRAGEVAAAADALAELGSADDADVRATAAAALAEIDLARGLSDAARARVSRSLGRDRDAAGDPARGALHVALAAVEEHDGRLAAARAALSRAASAYRLDTAARARVEVARARCLVAEGRLSEAERALAEAEVAAAEVDAAAVADEVRHARALVLGRRGRIADAAAILRDLVSRQRGRGDEIGALEAESDLAWLRCQSGDLSRAGELAAACAGSAARRGLGRLAAKAQLTLAAIEIAELRLPQALAAIDAVVSGSARDRATAAAAEELRHTALVRQKPAAADAADGMADEVAAARLRAVAAFTRRDGAAALDASRQVVAVAERAGRAAEAVEALATLGRLQLARGNQAAAQAAASRAARDARTCGLPRARSEALLVLAALARNEGDISAASAYAGDAAEIAADAGLSLQRLVAAQAVEVIAAGDFRGGGALAVARNAAAATVTDAVVDIAARFLSDLGLTAARPYRVVSADGQESFVADAGPALMRFEERALAVDGVRELVFRDGAQIADLRRRSLLKRLLFMFAAAPGRVFSKEEIVQSVWEVDYHPLRHDAALFTNIMRIRRLLGKDGADLIRVSEEGYRLAPPKDFVYVEKTLRD